MSVVQSPTIDPTVLNDVYSELAGLITTAPVTDAYIETLRAMLAAPVPAEQGEQIEAFIALCMDYRYLLGNIH